MTKFKTIDPAELLDDEETCGYYLTEVAASGDAAKMSHALGVVARARGMTKLAKETGLSRENLYRTLSSDGNPELSTLLKVVDALGMKLTVKVKQTA